MQRFRPACSGAALLVLGSGLLLGGLAAPAHGQFDNPMVGDQGEGRIVVPTNQVLTPAGRQITFPGRPTDLALIAEGRLAAIKNLHSLVFLDVTSGIIEQTLSLPHGRNGHAVAGLAVTEDGNTIYTSGTGNEVFVAGRKLALDHTLSPYHWDGSIRLPAPAVGGPAAPTGLALSDDKSTLLVLSGRGNTLLRFDVGTRKPIGEPIAVGVAPFAVAVVSEERAFVSNWGGDPPAPGDVQALSSKTPVKVDPRTGAAAAGSVSVIDLKQGSVVRSIATGSHPSGLALSSNRRYLYVACASNDTVEVIDTRTSAVVESIAVRPEHRLPFGSGPNAVAVSLDGGRLYVANGTNNAIAVVDLGGHSSTTPATEGESRLAGFIPVGWYPGAVAVRGWSRGILPPSFTSSHEMLIVANIKGVGSRNPRAEVGFNSHDYLGSVSAVLAPDAQKLERYTKQVASNNRQAFSLAGLEPPRPETPARPVPRRHGEPSTIKHVVYIIKENRTYDQVFGDMPRGRGDPHLVMFGREVTPNQHALAEQFILLDNFYCSGVLSADGHAWATEAYATDYLERQFGGFVRSYPYDGGDPLAYAPTGFLWDNALAHKKTFRDYGEFVKASIDPPDAKWRDLYRDYLEGATRVRVRARPGVETLRSYICPTYVGFPGTVPDVYRAREFLKEFHQFEADDKMPDLIIMLLPNNHTDGTRPGYPTPRAMVADNDLALGQVVEAITHSKFWPETAIFVTEDDPQAGLDHIDGHRTIGQVISPYTRRGVVEHSFYTQVSMVKTIELILGLPPMNQLDLAALSMRNCFRNEPDVRPFTALPNQVPLDEMNPAFSALSGPRLYWAQKSMELDLEDVDDADEDTLNRILWHATRGYDVPYPALAKKTDDEDDDGDGE